MISNYTTENLSKIEMIEFKELAERDVALAEFDSR